MESKIQTYARALFEVLNKVPAKEAPKVAQRFHFLLKRRGDLKAAGAVLRETERLLKERKGEQGTVVVASSLGKEEKANAAKALSSLGFVLQEQVRPEVGGGMAVFLGNHHLIDGTLGEKMRKIQRAIFS
ncbi:F0F1 ATP synthase subunit delta [Patescibacteria group bacterium]|nr:F0F1 ATP synthase subunit delta [Patescibacteria group bacterium]